MKYIQKEPKELKLWFWWILTTDDQVDSKIFMQMRFVIFALTFLWFPPGPERSRGHRNFEGDRVSNVKKWDDFIKNLNVEQNTQKMRRKKKRKKTKSLRVWLLIVSDCFDCSCFLREQKSWRSVFSLPRLWCRGSHRGTSCYLVMCHEWSNTLTKHCTSLQPSQR